jgi:hypothetical protein
MNSKSGHNKQRLLQLLADNATEVLAPSTAVEMAELLSRHPRYDEYYFDSAVAAIDLAMMPPPSDPLPKGLRDRILLDADRFLKTVQK